MLKATETLMLTIFQISWKLVGYIIPKCLVYHDIYIYCYMVSYDGIKTYESTIDSLHK